MEGLDKLFCVDGEWAGDAPTCKPHTSTTFLCQEGEYCTLQNEVPVCLLSKICFERCNIKTALSVNLGRRMFFLYLL